MSSKSDLPQTPNEYRRSLENRVANLELINAELLAALEGVIHRFHKDDWTNIYDAAAIATAQLAVLHTKEHQ